MVKIDDPTLALIVRFIGTKAGKPLTQQECMRLQVALIREHIAPYPREQHEKQAMAWIEKHAERFREECREKLLATALSGDNRCVDCPLADAADAGVCAIHDRWATLLQDFIEERVSSRDYIDQCLMLLREQKDRLKIATTKPKILQVS